MQNPKLKNGQLSKIEFLVLSTDKTKFKILCEKKNLSMAEVMKRAFEEKMEWLKKE